MRTLLFVVFALCFVEVSGQEAQKQPKPDLTRQSKPAYADAAPVRQPDGSLIHIVGTGSIFVPYTETVDGYTIVYGPGGIYQYAKLTAGGDLVPDGVNAHDPDKRTAKERKYLEKVEKHLRYQNPKLQDLLDHQKKMEPKRLKPTDKLK